MQRIPEENILNEIIKMIPKVLYPKTKVMNRDITLQDDLGIYGDDAVEFMFKFSEKFNVDISEFNYGKYFAPETNSLLTFLNLFKKKTVEKRNALTLGDLETFVKNKKAW